MQIDVQGYPSNVLAQIEQLMHGMGLGVTAASTQTTRVFRGRMQGCMGCLTLGIFGHTPSVSVTAVEVRSGTTRIHLRSNDRRLLQESVDRILKEFGGMETV